MSSDIVNLEVNGVPVQARKGQMIIQVTDAHEAYVPRFCYHDKLAVAANCRMCLVEVEKAPKPMPACATPVAEGMKVFTKSPKAIAAQKATMEFLLINHPLDCPICDQGGECELQDLAMGFGRDVSRYAERKRVVKDKNLGPLVSTDMTRCIHCTRCVRFTQEIQGLQELGTIGRGEATEIGTFIEKSVDHELSANIVDLCPVGALNNKPYRYRARAWEMTQHSLVSPHDAFGTNIYAHVLRGKVMRIVPRPNEAINETWIADRDRFSYEGIYSADRLDRPMVRDGSTWQVVDWETALTTVAERLNAIVKQHGAAQIGALASPLSTLEESYLLARVVRGLGSMNLDHRLRRTDFRDEEEDPLIPWLGCSIAELEQASAVLVVGAHLRREMPLLAHRLRQAAVKRGTRVSFVNSQRYEYLFPVAQYLSASDLTDSNGNAGADLCAHLAALVVAAGELSGRAVPAQVTAVTQQASVNAHHRQLVEQLSSGERRFILLGALAQRDPAFADVRVLAAVLAQLTGAELGYIPDGGNTAGAHLAGVLPRRKAGGRASQTAGLNVSEMLAARLKAYVLFGAIEPENDIAVRASDALRAAQLVVALTPYGTAKDYAHVILPIGTFAETSGTYVNLEGRWQRVDAAAKPVGEARPGWKVLRVLANLLGLPGNEYETSEQVSADLTRELGEVLLDNRFGGTRTLERAVTHAVSVGGVKSPHDVPIYQVDALVRRATALQQTRDGQRGTP